MNFCRTILCGGSKNELCFYEQARIWRTNSGFVFMWNKIYKNDSDKRTILKKYLERAPENKVIILEEYYDFKK